MRSLPTWRPIFAAAALLYSCLGAFADGTSMELIGRGFAPPAFYEFCRGHAGLCSTSSGRRIVPLTTAKLSDLQSVNSSVNHRIQSTTDQAVYGVEDKWAVPVNAGDCEDFAILKKQELLRHGWPSAALLLTVARLRFSDEGHVVLTVRTSTGDLVLDNRNDAVKDWSRTPYRYYARQAQDGSGWQRIGKPIPMPTTVSMIK